MGFQLNSDWRIIFFCTLYWTTHIDSKPVPNQTLPLEDLFKTHNQTNYLTSKFGKQSKVNFNEFLLSDPTINSVIHIDQILNNTDISRVCDVNIPNLSNPEELNYVNKFPQMLLCMGLSHILMLNSLLIQNNHGTELIVLPLPKNKSELDILVDQLNSNETLKNEVMCEQHKVTLPTYKTEVSEYIMLLNPHLENKNTCKEMCLLFDGKINPICAFIIEANTIFNERLNQNLKTADTIDVKNEDSAKAAEQNSDVDKIVPIFKKIVDEPKEAILPLEIENIKTNVTTLSNVSIPENKDSNLAKSIESGNIASSTVINLAINSSSTIIQKSSPLLVPDDENSNENTDDDYKEAEKQTPKIVETSQPNENPSTSNNPISSSPTTKIIDIEDNAMEADNGADNSLLDITTKLVTKSKVEKNDENVPIKVDIPEVQNKLKSTNIAKISDFGDKKVIQDDGENLDQMIVQDDEEELNELQPSQVKVDSQPGPQVAANNIDTLEKINQIPDDGRNNADDDGNFSSGVDHDHNKSYKQGEDPGLESMLDVQEKTPLILPEDGFVEAENSPFFTYFVLMFVLCIVMYLAFYNKRKIFALALEGRHAGGRRSRSRKHTAYSRVNTGYDDAKEHLLY